VFDLETLMYLYTVDATNSADGNWMRYVCCARFFEEQNIVSTQNGNDVYYKALKVGFSKLCCYCNNWKQKFAVFYFLFFYCKVLL